MGKDPSTSRPDITHQVYLLFTTWSTAQDVIDPPRQSIEQERIFASTLLFSLFFILFVGLYSYREERPHWGQSQDPYSTYIQEIRWIDEYLVYDFKFILNLVQLLHKLKIRSAEGNQTLMKVIKNPITNHLPIGARRIGISLDASDLIFVFFV